MCANTEQCIGVKYVSRCWQPGVGRTPCFRPYASSAEFPKVSSDKYINMFDNGYGSSSRAIASDKDAKQSVKTLSDKETPTDCNLCPFLNSCGPPSISRLVQAQGASDDATQIGLADCNLAGGFLEGCAELKNPKPSAPPPAPPPFIYVNTGDVSYAVFAGSLVAVMFVAALLGGLGVYCVMQDPDRADKVKRQLSGNNLGGKTPVTMTKQPSLNFSRDPAATSASSDVGKATEGV